MKVILINSKFNFPPCSRFVKMGNKASSGVEEESWRQNILRKSLGADDSLNDLMPAKSKFFLV